ncbi:MAG: class I SAM-dependent methyltransferase [Gammaproteobacteria bacterium]|nr:class I SAM-dependent methyltransferase [Gammaproteobacteria bacterium]
MTNKNLAPHCPLCASSATTFWHQDLRRPVAGREYWQCGHCALVFVPKEFHLEPAAEKAIYDLHENDPNDPGYRQFLSRALTPILRHFANASNRAELLGLDFGCGPGPAIAPMLAEEGLSCCNYDLYYWDDRELLTKRYDFIVSTEVFEHLARPRDAFSQLIPLLKPGGLLVIMTQRPLDLAAFSRWGYTLDPTHITFFRDETLSWLADFYQLPLIELSRDVAVFQKP